MLAWDTLFYHKTGSGRVQLTRLSDDEHQATEEVIHHQGDSPKESEEAMTTQEIREEYKRATGKDATMQFAGMGGVETDEYIAWLESRLARLEEENGKLREAVSYLWYGRDKDNMPRECRICGSSALDTKRESHSRTCPVPALLTEKG